MQLSRRRRRVVPLLIAPLALAATRGGGHRLRHPPARQRLHSPPRADGARQHAAAGDSEPEPRQRHRHHPDPDPHRHPRLADQPGRLRGVQRSRLRRAGLLPRAQRRRRHPRPDRGGHGLRRRRQRHRQPGLRAPAHRPRPGLRPGPRPRRWTTPERPTSARRPCPTSAASRSPPSTTSTRTCTRSAAAAHRATAAPSAGTAPCTRARRSSASSSSAWDSTAPRWSPTTRPTPRATPRSWCDGLHAEGYHVLSQTVDLALPDFQAVAAAMKADGTQLLFDAMDTRGNAALCDAMDAAGVRVTGEGHQRRELGRVGPRGLPLLPRLPQRPVGDLLQPELRGRPVPGGRAVPRRDGALLPGPGSRSCPPGTWKAGRPHSGSPTPSTPAART